MHARLVCIAVLAACSAAPLAAEHGKSSADHEQILRHLMESILQKNNRSSESSGLVFMPPTFSVDIISLLRWAVELESQQHNVRPRAGKSLELRKEPAPYSWSTLNFVQLGGKNYFVSRNEKASWFDALHFCRSFGMDLVSIETREENELIAQHLASLGLSGQFVFISGHKIGRSTYIWLNGEPLIYEDWLPGDPAQFSTENCMIAWKKQWADLPCEHPTYFMCEEQ